MKIKVTKNQFKMLLDNPQLLMKGVGLKFRGDLVRKVLSTSNIRGPIGRVAVVDLNKPT